MSTVSASLSPFLSNSTHVLPLFTKYTNSSLIITVACIMNTHIVPWLHIKILLLSFDWQVYKNHCRCYEISFLRVVMIYQGRYISFNPNPHTSGRYQESFYLKEFLWIPVIVSWFLFKNFSFKLILPTTFVISFVPSVVWLQFIALNRSDYIPIDPVFSILIFMVSSIFSIQHSRF